MPPSQPICYKGCTPPISKSLTSSHSSGVATDRSARATAPSSSIGGQSACGGSGGAVGGGGRRKVLAQRGSKPPRPPPSNTTNTPAASLATRPSASASATPTEEDTMAASDDSLSHGSMDSIQEVDSPSDDERGDGISGPGAQNKRKTSEVWILFEEVIVPSKKKKGEIQTKAKCTTCFKYFAYTPRGPTTTLRRHMKICNAYNIQISKKKKQEDKVSTITFDNASNNDVAARSLRGRLVARINSSVLLEGRFFHNRCCCRILNLCVGDGLKPLEPLIGKLREAMKYLKKCPARLYKFCEVVKSLTLLTKRGLCLDVPTRWGSTYKMLECCFTYKDAFTHYFDLDQVYKWESCEYEWDTYEVVREVLSVFDNTSTLFSGSTYPNANLFFPLIIDVKVKLTEAVNSSNLMLQEMGKAMAEKFDKYWGECSELAIATILDPRYKIKFINYFFGKIYDAETVDEKVSLVRSTLDDLYAGYELDHENQSATTNSGAATSSQFDATQMASSNCSSEFKILLEASSSMPTKSDLMCYLDYPNERAPTVSFSVFEWWRFNAPKYPVLSKLAKDILTIPISTVSAESSFSVGGRVLDDYRSSLDPSTMEALVCTSSWLRGSSAMKIVEQEPGIEMVDHTIPLNDSVGAVGSN